jgi:hypothetical protein
MAGEEPQTTTSSFLMMIGVVLQQWSEAIWSLLLFAISQALQQYGSQARGWETSPKKHTAG